MCRNLDCDALAVGGVEDHVHILLCLSRTQTVADLVRELKTKAADLAGFGWQNGYGAFSVSPSHVEALRRYIANQEAHHRAETFQEELRRILRKYGVAYDERYVWD